MHRFRPRQPSPAMLVALTALFIALSGGAYAAITSLPRNSVGTAQLKDNAVISSKVKDHSLLGQDIKPGQLPKGRHIFDNSGGAGPTLRKRGTYLISVQPVINNTTTSDYGRCAVEASKGTSAPGVIQGSWVIAPASTAFPALTGTVVIGFAPAATKVSCFDLSGHSTTIEASSWWVWFAGP